MGFFTMRERRELSKPAEITEFVPSRRFRSHDDNMGSMQRLTEASLQEIDDLIAELLIRREKLLSESARVQREIIAYAKLSQSTMQSTKVVTDGLANWSKIPRTSSESEVPLHADNHDGEAGPSAQPDVGAGSDNPGPEMT
jgi:hypothetical protein